MFGLPSKFNPAANPSRRDFLLRTGAGFGGVALTALLAAEARADQRKPAVTFDSAGPLAPRLPHLPAKAKNVIFLFMYGGPGSMDLFDYKPKLQELHGKPVPESFKKSFGLAGSLNMNKDELMGGPWKWARHGKSGLWVSDMMPHTARHADDLCVIRSMVSDSSNHAPATFQMNTGAIISGKPSMGSWITYGLGSQNQNLPGYVLLYKVAGLGGSGNWSNGFLPAAFQGTQFRHEGAPVLDLNPPDEFASVQRSTIDAVQAFNRKHLQSRPGQLDLEGRISSYELAYRMQSEALTVGDVASESVATREMYGLEEKNKDTAMFGRMCLLSRRLVEKGVRFVQLYSAVDKNGWDAHDKNEDYVRRNSAQVDKPVAALLADLKQRGMLDETLVVWAGEFGRTPMVQGSSGRNHNPLGFTVWMAGGGIQGGRVIGETDEIGLRAVVDPHPVKNLHATILHALGLRHDDLYFEHSGRPERLTGVAGTAKIISGAIAT